MRTSKLAIRSRAPKLAPVFAPGLHLSAPTSVGCSRSLIRAPALPDPVDSGADSDQLRGNRSSALVSRSSAAAISVWASPNRSSRRAHSRLTNARGYSSSSACHTRSSPSSGATAASPVARRQIHRHPSGLRKSMSPSGRTTSSPPAMSRRDTSPLARTTSSLPCASRCTASPFIRPSIRCPPRRTMLRRRSAAAAAPRHPHRATPTPRRARRPPLSWAIRASSLCNLLPCPREKRTQRRLSGRDERGGLRGWAGKIGRTG